MLYFVRNAKITELDATVLKENILGLKILMDYAFRVKVGERFSYLNYDTFHDLHVADLL